MENNNLDQISPNIQPDLNVGIPQQANFNPFNEQELIPTTIDVPRKKWYSIFTGDITIWKFKIKKIILIIIALIIIGVVVYYFWNKYKNKKAVYPAFKDNAKALALKGFEPLFA